MPAEIREYLHGRLKMIRHLVFDGWELIAQQTQQFTLNLDNRVELMAGEVQTQYAVSAPTGEPLALFDPEGKRVWRRPKQSLYGLRLSGHGENPQLDPGLRFAGQLFDEESGLFYNRFRYYLPEAACYLSPDPIGLLGGFNPYGYVHNPTGWVDPFGLSSFDPFIHGDITDFPKDLHFGQNRIAPNFSSIGSQADPLITGRPILDVANDIKVGKISPDTFVISYTIDPATGKSVTLNNRGLAAIVESGKFPQSAIYVPYEHVPKHLVADILDRPPSK